MKTISEVIEETLRLSDDANTQTSAVLTTADGFILAAAANTLTRGVPATMENTMRPGKMPWIEHAERNVLFLAGRQGIKTDGLHMHMAWFPCCECARAIAQCGISVLHCDPEPEPCVKYRFQDAAIILRAAGVELVHPRMPDPADFLIAGI